MRAVQIVVNSPVFNDVPGMAIAAERVLVDALISQAPMKLSTEHSAWV